MGLRYIGANPEGDTMIEAIRKSIALPRVPVDRVISVATIATFGWLLLNDQIHPLAVYILRFYLTF